MSNIGEESSKPSTPVADPVSCPCCSRVSVAGCLELSVPWDLLSPLPYPDLVCSLLFENSGSKTSIIHRP